MIVNRPKKKKPISRYTIMKIISTSIIGIIFVRLLYLQVFSYDDYKEKANTTSTKFVSEVAPRGKILDSNGISLATNEITYSLTYTETSEVKKKFYSTMTELFKILEENNGSIPDTMLLKINNDNSMYFAYTTDNEEGHNYEELRFKKDRGFNDEIKNELFKNVTDLSEEQESTINTELLKLTPEETFYKLVKNYGLIELVDPNYTENKEKKELYSNMTGEELTKKILESGYSLQDIKKYMLIKDIIKIQNLQGNRTITIASNIDKDTVLTIKQKLTDLPGIDVASVPIRKYPYENLTSSVLGYVSAINSSEESKYALRGYDVSSDLVGKSGIESAFEDQLKGVKGGTTVKVNSSGRVTEKLFELESYPGNNVQLSIDAGLQWAAEKALQDTINNIQTIRDNTTGYNYKNATRGALIALDVNTGKVRAMVSYPDYNPNDFTIPGTLSEEKNRQYFNPDLKSFGEELIKKMSLDKTVDQLFPDGQDKYDLYPKPFYNYATMSLIPPGSTYKPLTSVAALESGVVGVDETIYDSGQFIKKDLFESTSSAPRCWNKSGHGAVDVKKALAVSCNVYYYELGYRLYENAIKNGKTKQEALNSIANYAWQFGLGVDPNSDQTESTGIEISERFGQSYNFTSWKDQSIYYSKFEIVSYLESGDYKGVGITFIPFDIGYNDDDIEQVKNSKKAIKDAITNALEKVGTDEKVDEAEFTKSIKKEVQNIINYSDEYKSRVSNYESETGKTVDLEHQANQVTEAIRRFTLADKPSEINTPAQIVYAAIGQGMNNYTPLQLASYVATIANGGTRYKVSLVDKIMSNENQIIEEYKPEVLNSLNISAKTLAAVKEGMSRVNDDQDGTAYDKFSTFPIKTAGKTGTADFSESQNENGRAPYATYVSFAPVDNPEIAVVAVVFDGGHGGYAAQAVRGVYDYYFKDRLKSENPGYTSDYFVKYVENNPFYKLEEKTEESNDDASMN